METTYYDRTGEPIEPYETPSVECLLCKDSDPQIRARHHLSLARQGGLDLLKPHLYRHYAQAPRITTEERREAVESLCGWVAGLMQQWSGFADDTTGASLPWWEARQQAIRRKNMIAASAYTQAPEAFKTRQSIPEVVGFSRVGSSTDSTLQREPMRYVEPDESEYIQEPEED